MFVYILCDMVLKRKWGTHYNEERLTWENWYLGYVVTMVTGFNDGRQYQCKEFLVA